MPDVDKMARVLLVSSSDPAASLIGGRVSRELLDAASEGGGTSNLRLWLASDADLPADLDLVVAVQSHPAEVPLTFYERWQRRFPLARLVTVWGPWCIGGSRNGHPYPGTNYVSWLSWPWQARMFLHQFWQGRPTHWDWPPTRTMVDRISRAGSVDAAADLNGLVINVVADSTGASTVLVEACNELGWAAKGYSLDLSGCEHDREPHADTPWLWEVPPSHATPQAFWRQRRHLPGPCVALLGFAEITAESFVEPWTSQEYGGKDASAWPTILLPNPFLFSELQSAVRYLRLQDSGRSQRV